MGQGKKKCEYQQKGVDSTGGGSVPSVDYPDAFSNCAKQIGGYVFGSNNMLGPIEEKALQNTLRARGFGPK